MSSELPPQALELLRKPVLAHVATVMKDGSPQVTPVWVDTDGERILINSAEGRIKVRNMRRNPHVAVSVVDPANSYRGSLWVRGTVVEITAQGADDHIDRLALKYTGGRYKNRRPGEGRLTIKIRPDRVGGGIMRG